MQRDSTSTSSKGPNPDLCGCRTSPYPHYQFTSHYPQAAYTTHYQPYAPPTTAATAQARTATTPITAYQSASYAFNTSTSTATTVATTTAANASAIDTSDIATLNDALGSTGVDLKASHISKKLSSAILIHNCF